MAQAVNDKLDNGTYGGRIPPSSLEDWVLLGMKPAHTL
jgi:hypothetical protein